jgi:hypothetical protein
MKRHDPTTVATVSAARSGIDSPSCSARLGATRRCAGAQLLEPLVLGHWAV